MPKSRPKPKRYTRWQKHKRKWEDCTRCPLCEVRRRTVLLKGALPCDILFIGEAPGDSEDSLGKPFMGPAGKLLDSMIADAFGTFPVRTAFTNLIACIPKEDGKKANEPPKFALQACSARIVDLVDFAWPQIIVMVGKLPEKWLPTILKDSDILEHVKFVKLTHPSAILRMSVAQQGLEFQKCVSRLGDVIEDIVPF